jgi:adenylate cyclase
MILTFGDHELDLPRRELRRGNQKIHLEPQVFDLLAYLVEHRNHVVSKDEILSGVWHGRIVSESALTVRVNAVRKALGDDGRAQQFIRTLPRKGMRFVADVREVAAPGDSEVFEGQSRSLLPTTPVIAVHAPSYLEPAYQGGVAWDERPRMSIVVLPFVNLSGRPAEDYLADGITDDLTADLSRIADAVVISRASAFAYKGKSKDVRKVGEELGVRYVLEGSVRRVEATLKVNVQLISAETGAQLWSDRFDEQITEIAAGQEHIVARVRDGLGRSIVEIESARYLRDRRTNPTAFDLVLRARSLRYQPQSLERDKDVQALFERALLMDPSSVSALTGVAYSLIARRPAGTSWGNFDDLERTERLLAQAHASAPESEQVLSTTVYWLRSVGRCAEAIEAAQRIIQIDPKRVRVMTGIYNELAICKTWTGYAEEGIALQEQANQLNPRSTARFLRYRRMGWGSLLLGRDQDAINYLQRSLAIKSQVDVGTHRTYRQLAAAYARTGQMEEARKWLTKADRLWPYDTVRSHFPDGQSSAVYAEQIKGYQAALRLAGERDHADEAADFGVPTDGVLHSEFSGFTPTNAPGARTIRTADLVGLLADVQPIVVDTMTYSWGQSIPGAVGLGFAGLGGSYTDAAQDRLGSKIGDLTEGALDKPIVAVGWNAERFDGRNLALRIAALGYSNVYWYRGGREAWEMSGLPETDVMATPW